jgi:hypothetical protein
MEEQSMYALTINHAHFLCLRFRLSENALPEYNMKPVLYLRLDLVGA